MPGEPIAAFGPVAQCHGADPRSSRRQQSLNMEKVPRSATDRCIFAIPGSRSTGTGPLGPLKAAPAPVSRRNASTACALPSGGLRGASAKNCALPELPRRGHSGRARRWTLRWIGDRLLAPAENSGGIPNTNCTGEHVSNRLRIAGNSVFPNRRSRRAPAEKRPLWVTRGINHYRRKERRCPEGARSWRLRCTVGRQSRRKGPSGAWCARLNRSR